MPDRDLRCNQWNCTCPADYTGQRCETRLPQTGESIHENLAIGTATVNTALILAVSLVLLSVAGFFESAIHGKSGWTGAVRVVLTGAVAATAAFLIAKLFV